MTELEMIMLQWFGQMIALPKEFLPFTPQGRGGGVIQVGCNTIKKVVFFFKKEHIIFKALGNQKDFLCNFWVQSNKPNT